jgi:5'-nucleotidase
LIDAGDAVSAGNVGVRPGGEPILTLMSELGYQAMTMGNREFHVADTLLRYKIADAGFPILCANMRWREDRGEDLPTRPFVILETEGLRVGVIGVTVPMVTVRMSARVISAFLFDDPVECVKNLAAQLRPQVDVLVALTHIGSRDDQRLARSCPELDIVIGGHSHDVLPQPVVYGDVPVVQAGAHGRYLGVLDLPVEDGRVIRERTTGLLVALK